MRHGQSFGRWLHWTAAMWAKRVHICSVEGPQGWLNPESLVCLKTLIMHPLTWGAAAEGGWITPPEVVMVVNKVPSPSPLPSHISPSAARAMKLNGASASGLCPTRPDHSCSSIRPSMTCSICIFSQFWPGNKATQCTLKENHGMNCEVEWVWVKTLEKMSGSLPSTNFPTP